MKSLVLILCLPFCLHSLPPAYVWSLGFCECADVKPKKRDFEGWMNCMEDRYVYQPKHYIQSIYEGSIVWIKADWFLAFVQDVLPRVKVPFILIVGATDATFYQDYPEKQALIKAIESPLLIHLFIQNCAYTHKKITQIPIGIDLHTSVYWPERHGSNKTLLPMQQLKELESICSSLKPTEDRPIKSICDFAFNDSMHGKYQRHLDFHEDRKTIWSILATKGFATHLSQKVSRKELWQLKGGCAFDISPPGNGVDCHRTWESLALGCIVIIKDSFLNPLFEDLPVVIVKSWSDISEQSLHQWKDAFKGAFTQPKYRKKLLQSTWNELIREKQREYLLKS